MAVKKKGPKRRRCEGQERRPRPQSQEEVQKGRQAPAAKKSVKAAAQKAPTKKNTIGEGDYAASRSFLKGPVGFVAKNSPRFRHGQSSGSGFGRPPGR